VAVASFYHILPAKEVVVPASGLASYKSIPEDGMGTFGGYYSHGYCPFPAGSFMHVQYRQNRQFVKRTCDSSAVVVRAFGIEILDVRSIFSIEAEDLKTKLLCVHPRIMRQFTSIRFSFFGFSNS
jgi:hypothetical protein